MLLVSDVLGQSKPSQASTLSDILGTSDAGSGSNDSDILAKDTDKASLADFARYALRQICSQVRSHNATGVCNFINGVKLNKADLQHHMPFS